MRDLIGPAKCVIFDFDGPLCHLFHRFPAPGVADRLRELIPAAHPGNGSLSSDAPFSDVDDPYVILQRAFADPASVADGTAHAVERALTREEVRAASHAYPTPYADSLVRTLSSTGRRLAVATNNAQQAVERYLETRLTGALFAGHVHGRCADAGLRLKPDPDCLVRALESTGVAPGDALMIGDAPRDLAAARAAGVSFLGYGRNERKAAALRAAGLEAEDMVDSLRSVLKCVDPGAHV
ncbi:HAD family hydrolase [Streptomyces sp. NPDC054796]